MRMLLTLLLALAAFPAQATTELKIASWNIAWLTLRPQGDRDLPRDLTLRGPADFARLRAYADRLAADIVALQEVDGPDAAARVFDPRTHEFHFPDERDIHLFLVDREGKVYWRETGAYSTAKGASLKTAVTFSLAAQ